MAIVTERVRRRIARDFPDPETAALAVELVRAVSDSERVQAAVVLIANGDLTDLRRTCEGARKGVGDVLTSSGLAATNWHDHLDAEFGPVDEDDAACRYEVAEEAFLAAIRAGDDRETLTTLADEVAAQAELWNTTAYIAFHASSGDERDRLDMTTEVTELLENLWRDIARAFHGRPAVRDG